MNMNTKKFGVFVFVFMNTVVFVKSLARSAVLSFDSDVETSERMARRDGGGQKWGQEVRRAPPVAD